MNSYVALDFFFLDFFTTPLALWANPERPVRMVDEEIFPKRPWKRLQVFTEKKIKYLSWQIPQLIPTMEGCLWPPWRCVLFLSSAKSNCHSNVETKKQEMRANSSQLLFYDDEYFLSRLVGRRPRRWARCLNRVYLPFLKSSSFLLK